MHLLITSTLVSIMISCARGGLTPIGGSCSTQANKLDPATHKLLTDCDTKGFCSSTTGKCEPKGCRKDEFPFGYDEYDVLPPLCDKGSFYCPDEESTCLPLRHVGEGCQLNRDDQCLTPGGDFMDYQHLNSGESICLHFTCMYANVTFGLPCIIDNTAYIGFGPGGQELTNLVSRDNCMLGYCDAESRVCLNAKLDGVDCRGDRECASGNCNTNNMCVEAPETPVTVAPWQYALVSIAIIIGIISIWIILFMTHKRHRAQRKLEIMEYYRQQTAYRNSIIALHTAAAHRTASIYSTDSKRSNNALMIQNYDSFK